MSTNSLNNRRKLHPLMPSPQNTTYSAIPTISLHPHQVSDVQRRTEPIISSRWNPTRDQIRVLEEIYRGGTRTPSPDQIQQIVSMLRCFGRVEGKNVFYWFQNHKARERQKRRRQFESPSLVKKYIPNSEILRTLVAKREIDDQFQVLQQINFSTIPNAHVGSHEDENREPKTLQLFPSQLDCGINVNAVKDDAADQAQITSTTTSFVRTPVQFFQFLPLKS